MLDVGKSKLLSHKSHLKCMILEIFKGQRKDEIPLRVNNFYQSYLFTIEDNMIDKKYSEGVTI